MTRCCLLFNNKKAFKNNSTYTQSFEKEGKKCKSRRILVKSSVFRPLANKKTRQLF